MAAWLASHGFQIGVISRGRTVIEFSGTAAQVQQAFHTEIHKFVVNGETHWANTSDPQIPQALTPVIVGINSLHNFAKKPAHRIGGVYSKSRLTGEVKSLRPGFTYPGGTNLCGPTSLCYFVGPYDFAKIYNVLPLWNASPVIDGTGQSIAILGRSDIVLQECVRDFRALFNLPANDPNFIVNGVDPGIISGDETEAVLDVEWSGAVAKGATIHLVISSSTETTDGVDLSRCLRQSKTMWPRSSTKVFCSASCFWERPAIALRTPSASKPPLKALHFLQRRATKVPRAAILPPVILQHRRLMD